MKIKVGKFYRTTTGRVVEILKDKGDGWFSAVDAEACFPYWVRPDLSLVTGKRQKEFIDAKSESKCA